ncbi:hypothetical protein CTAYLR_001281, partial [Chrysophaeum taylorii]
VLALPDGLQRFPADFAWGSATAAYQIEGGAKADGRGPSIWDTFSHTPFKTYKNQTGDIADDHYHRREFAEDIALMKSLGLKHYRLSLSWSRLLPKGRGSTFNQAGLNFYMAIFRLLSDSGIEPLVTLYHWDLPQALEDAYGGWRSQDVVEDFADFADMAFDAFGTYVKSWLTFNEALTFIGEGYGDGVHARSSSLPERSSAPGRCSDRRRCAEGDSNLEPVIAAHNVLLAHAAAVGKFRRRFAGQPRYEIGTTNCGHMTYPLRESDTERNQEFMEGQFGWFFDPVVYGDYPESMKRRVGDAMPAFTPEQSAALRGSVDFLGVNYYTARWIAVPDKIHRPSPSANGIPFLNAMFTMTAYDDNRVAIGPRAGSEWLYVVPEGIHDVLVWINNRYPTNPLTGSPYDLRITENGLAMPFRLELSVSDALNDTFRVDFFRSHIEEVARAIAEGVRVTAYYAWSLLDNFEWADGYSKRFGIVYVDYETQTRTAKLSAWWYSALMEAHAATHRLGPVAPRGSPPAAFASKHTAALAAPLVLFASVAMLAILALARRPQSSLPNTRVELPSCPPPTPVAQSRFASHRYNRIP